VDACCAQYVAEMVGQRMAKRQGKPLAPWYPVASTLAPPLSKHQCVQAPGDTVVFGTTVLMVSNSVSQESELPDGTSLGQQTQCHVSFSFLCVC